MANDKQGAPQPWELLRRQPPLHLVRLDEDIYAPALDEARRHGHDVAEWHVAAASRYATCTRCRYSAWWQAGPVTSLEVGLLLPCRGEELAEHKRLREKL